MMMSDALHQLPLLPWQRKGHRTNSGGGARTQTSRKKPFSQVLLSASHRPSLQITPLNSIYSETILNKQLVEGLTWVTTLKQIGHSVTNIISFSFPENASLILLISSLKAQPYYSSPYQTALGSHFHFVCGI